VLASRTSRSALTVRPAANQDRALRLRERARLLELRYGAADSETVLEAAIKHVFPGRIAVVSSFGAESAVLLDLVARIDPATPVIFLETGKHFDETLAYRDGLAERLGLTDLRSVTPAAEDLGRADADGTLWQRNPDLCCHLRKVLPLQRALSGFSAWINGRKRFQGGLRGAIPVFEAETGRIKVNPLAHWDAAQLREAFETRGLPTHPLAEQGYASIGCVPCTAPSEVPAEGAEAGSRSGRWQGSGKTECGIHKAPWARQQIPRA